MVSVQIAGFGGEISLQEIVLILQVFFVAVFIVNLVFAPSGENVIQVLAERVIGYPTCTAAMCFLPSQDTLAAFGQSFANLFSPNLNLQDIINLVWGGQKILFGLLGLIVVITAFVGGLQLLYGWYFFWGSIQRRVERINMVKYKRGIKVLREFSTESSFKKWRAKVDDTLGKGYLRFRLVKHKGKVGITAAEFTKKGNMHFRIFRTEIETFAKPLGQLAGVRFTEYRTMQALTSIPFAKQLIGHAWKLPGTK